MSIRMQLGGLMALFMALLLAAITAVCLQFASAQSTHLASERNHFLLNSLRKTAEDFLATGMTPEQMPAMQDVIDREKSSFAQLLSIDMFTPAGRITYSTDAGAFNTQVPADWVEKLAQTGAWETQDPTQDQLGMRFENNLGRAAGGIVLTLQPADSPWSLKQWQQAGVQALRWLALGVVSCAAALVLGLWQLQRSLQPYRQVPKILAQDSAPADSTQGTALQQASWQASQTLTQNYAQTQQALARLQELDRDS